MSETLAPLRQYRHGDYEACPELAEGMKRLMHEHGLEEPIFEERGTFFKATFRGPGDRILDLVPRAGVTDLRELGLTERQIEALRLSAPRSVQK